MQNKIILQLMDWLWKKLNRQQKMEFTGKALTELSGLTTEQFMKQLSTQTQAGTARPYNPIVEVIDKPLDEHFNRLLRTHQIDKEGLTTIFEKCNDDEVKVEKVLRIMSLEYQTDDYVIEHFEHLCKRYAHKLKGI